MDLVLNDAIETAADRRSVPRRLVVAAKSLFSARQTLDEDAPALRTTAALNLRAKPSATAKIVRVIPRDAAVRDLAGARNGYAKIAFNGTSGWAYDAFLTEG